MIVKGLIQDHLDKYPQNRGWIVGEFLEKDNPLYNSQVQVKWVTHISGESREGSVSENPNVSIDIVLKGRCRFVFPSHKMEFELEEGEYITYNTAECTHTFEAITDCNLIIIRTPSQYDN